MKRRATVTIAILCGVLGAAFAAPSSAQEGADQAPATQLRVALDRVLAEHAFLIVQVMRTGLTPGPEFQAAGDALNENTDELVGAIRSVYGSGAADAFAEQWRNHIGFIVDYARALDARNNSAAQIADSQLRDYVKKFSTLLAGAVDLPEATVEGLIREHVDQLEQVASFERSHFGEAYPAIRATYRHMFTIGDGLATAIVAQFPNRFKGREFAFSPAIDLRLDLDRLLGEHTELAALAMRAKLTLSADVDAATTALDANTEELSASIRSIYGDEAGAAFQLQWREHTQFYLAYLTGKRANDSGAQDAALDGLRSYRTAFTNFLVKANPLLSRAKFEQLIGDHTDHIVAEADQYATGSYAAAYDTGRKAFAQSGVLSAYLATAIANQFPGRFPDTAFASSNTDLRLIGVMLVFLAGLLLVSGRAPIFRRLTIRSGSGRPPDLR